MLRLKKHKLFMESPQILSDRGPKKVLLHTLPLTADIEDISSKIKHKPDAKLYMLECPLRNKNKICTDKLNFLKINIQTIQLSHTSQAGLISKGKNLIPFWNKFSAEMSKKLWSHHKIGSHVLDSNLSKISVNTSIPNSSLKIIKYKKLTSKNSQKTSYQSLRFLQPDITDHVDTTKITRTIKFQPSMELKKYLNKCFGTYRYFYNKGVRYLKDKYNNNSKIIKYRIKKNKCCHKDNGKFVCHKQLFNSTYCEKHKNCKTAYKITYNIQELRKQLILNSKDLKKNDQLKWQLDIPYDLKQNALREMLSGIKSGVANYKNNNTKYNLKYKTKKALHNTFRIPNSFIKLEKQQLFIGYGEKSKNTFNLDSRTCRWIKNNKYLLNDTITIGRNGKNNYYMYLSYDTPIKKVKKPFNIVAIDPGVRGFCNIYSPDGMEGCLGDKFDRELMKIGKRIDCLISLRNIKKTDNQGNKMFENNSKTRRNMKFRCEKLRNKLKNKVDDLHNKIINFLCINFDTIVIPEFDVKNKVKTNNRKISNEVVRRMLCLRHGKFLEKLKSYCKRIKTNLILVSEEYTSQTCGHCGNIKKDLGNAKTYICNKCGYKGDRDINAGRNILIQLLTKLNNMTSQSSDVIPVGKD